MAYWIGVVASGVLVILLAFGNDLPAPFRFTAALCVAAAGLFHDLQIRPFLPGAVPVPAPRGRFWWRAGLLCVLAALLCLEMRVPFFFTAEDNYRNTLPVVLGALGGFFQTGIFPTWDAYSGLGQDITGYGLTYPPLYLAYFLSLLMGNAPLTLEILAFLHIIAAYVLMTAACRRLGATPFLSACAAASFALCGYTLVAGRTGYAAIGAPVYLAALLYLLTFIVAGERLHLRWAAGLAAAIGLFFHLGQPAFFTYGMLGFAVALGWALCARRLRDVRDVALLLAGVLGGFALAAPMWCVLEAQQYLRYPAFVFPDAGIAPYLNQLLLPALEKTESLKENIQLLILFSGGVYGVAALALLAGVLASLLRAPLRLPPVGAYAVAAVFCLLAAMGDGLPFWGWISARPLIDAYRNAGMWIPVLTVFTLASGVAVMAELGQRSAACRAVAVSALLGVAASAWHAAQASSVIPQQHDAPYPALAKPVEGIRVQQELQLNPSRVLSVGPGWSYGREAAWRFNNNYASYYKVFSGNRFNWNVPFSPRLEKAYALAASDPALFMRRFSVGWLARSSVVGYDDFDQPDYDMAALTQFSNEAAPVTDRRKTLSGLTLLTLETSLSDPLVGLYSADPACYAPLPLSFRAVPDGLAIDISGDPEPGFAPHAVVAAFLYHPWMQATAEPGHVPMTVIDDAYGRIRLVVDGTKAPKRRVDEIRLRLSPPWGEGFALAAWLLSAALLLAWLARPKTKG